MIKLVSFTSCPKTGYQEQPACICLPRPVDSSEISCLPSFLEAPDMVSPVLGREESSAY